MVTKAFAQHLRATARRIRATTGVRRTAPATVSAVLVGAIALSLSSAGGTTALWSGSVTVDVPTITAGSVKPTIANFAGMAATFTPDAPGKSARVTIRNTGTVPAIASLQLSAENDSGLGSAVSVTAWLSTTTSCAVQPAPLAPVGATFAADTASYLGTWAANDLSPVRIPLAAAGQPNDRTWICISSRVAPSLVTDGATVTARLTVNMTTQQTSSWSSSATMTAVQTYSSARTTGSDYSDTVLRDGATRFWRLSEANASTTIYDEVGTDDGFAATGRTSVTGAIGRDTDKAADFDGTGAATTRTMMSSPTSFSLEGWFKTDSATGGKLIGFGDGFGSGSTMFDRQLYLDAAGTVNFGVLTASSTRSVVSTAAGVRYNNNAWHYVVGTLDGGVQRLYIDGVEVGTRSGVSPMVYTGSWQLVGGKSWAGDDNFDGTADELAVYGKALSAQQVISHWNLSGKGAYPAGAGDAYGALVYDDAPYLFWRLGETTGTKALDYSGRSRTGTYTGMTMNAQAGAVAGTRSPSTAFDGSGFIASTADVASPNAFTVELWFNTTSTTGGKLIGLGSANVGDSTQYDRQVYLRNDGGLVFGVYPSSPGVTIDSGTQTYRDGAWHHVVASQALDGTIRLYVDGKLVAQNTAAGGFTYPTNPYWRVGGDSLTSWPSQPTTNYVTGGIDEVAVYTSELTPAQIAEHYSVGAARGIAVAAATTGGTSYTRSFDGSGSFTFPAAPMSYSWTFSGTSTVNGANSAYTATATGVSPNWTFKPGTYTATLTVTGAGGATGTAATAPFTVKDDSPPLTPGVPTVLYTTETSAALMWAAYGDDYSNPVTYEVFRNGVSRGTATQGYFTDSITPGVAYTYTVTARDTAGNTSAKSATSATVKSISFANSTFRVQGYSSGQCVTSAGFATSLTQAVCDPLAAGQVWLFKPYGDGSYGVTAPTATATDPVYGWEVQYGSTGDAPVLLNPYTGQPYQRWTPAQLANGRYAFVPSTASGTLLCLTSVPGTVPPATVRQQACAIGYGPNGTYTVADSQQFTLTAVTP